MNLKPTGTIKRCQNTSNNAFGSNVQGLVVCGRKQTCGGVSFVPATKIPRIDPTLGLGILTGPCQALLLPTPTMSARKKERLAITMGKS